MGGLLLAWTSYFTGRLSDTQSQYFCGALSNAQIGIWIWGIGGGVCWAELVPSLVDCQIHNLSTSVEFSQIGTWIWGLGGGGLLVMLTSSDRLTLPYMRSLYSWFSCACSLRFKCVSL